MLVRNQNISHASLFALVVGLPAAGCTMTGDIQTGLESEDGRSYSRRTDGSLGPKTPPTIPDHCTTLDFDKDGNGQQIEAGRILLDAYASQGISIRAFRGPKGDEHGIPVAFDSDHPTGGDDDLAFDELGNLLISQECWDQDELDRGIVKEPDDNSYGARFEFTFDEPVCIPGLTLLDVDKGEDPVYIKFFDADGNRVFETSVPPMGNNERIDVTLPLQDDCNVVKAVVKLSGSGAMDNLEVCESPTAGAEVFVDAPQAAGFQEAAGVAIDAEGNVLVTGTNGDSIFLRKLTPSGEVVFDRDLAEGTGASVAVLGGNTPVVFGNDPDGNLYLAIVDGDSGDVVRTPTLPALGRATAVDVRAVGSDIFFVADVRDTGDVVVVKLEDNGNDERAEFDTGVVDNAAALATDANGNLAVAVNGDGTFIVTYDSNLNQTNIIPLAGLLDEDFGVVTGVAFNSAGHLLVVGDELGLPTTIRLLKLDADGSQIAQTTFENASDDDFSAGVAVDGADNVIVAGSVVNADGNFDVWVRKVDADFQREFPRALDLGGEDAVNDVTTDDAGNIIVVGRTDRDGDDLLAVKFAP